MKTYLGMKTRNSLENNFQFKTSKANLVELKEVFI